MHQKPDLDLTALIAFMKELRLRSKKSRRSVEDCMQVGKDTYRQVETYYRPPPDFQHGFVQWLRDFLRCVGATPEEEQTAMDLASRVLVKQFADWMDDLRNRSGNGYE